MEINDINKINCNIKNVHVGKLKTNAFILCNKNNANNAINRSYKKWRTHQIDDLMLHTYAYTHTYYDIYGYVYGYICKYIL